MSLMAVPEWSHEWPGKSPFHDQGLIASLRTTGAFAGVQVHCNREMHTPVHHAGDAITPLSFLSQTAGHFGTAAHDERPGAAFTIELPRRHSVNPTHYSLRNGCHDLESYLQHWVLEANPRHHTDDGWITLSEHVNDNWVEAAHYWDTHQGLPFFEHSWELRPSSDHPPFVRFRVRMTGRNAANEFDICCSGFELYGIGPPAWWSLGSHLRQPTRLRAAVCTVMLVVGRANTKRLQTESAVGASNHGMSAFTAKACIGVPLEIWTGILENLSWHDYVRQDAKDHKKSELEAQAAKIQTQITTLEDELERIRVCVARLEDSSDDFY